MYKAVNKPVKLKTSLAQEEQTQDPIDESLGTGGHAEGLPQALLSLSRTGDPHRSRILIDLPPCATDADITANRKCFMNYSPSRSQKNVDIQKDANVQQDVAVQKEFAVFTKKKLITSNGQEQMKELMIRNCSEVMSNSSTDSDNEGSVDFDAVLFEL